MDSKTVSLLKIIGSPFVKKRNSPRYNFFGEQYLLAFRNKIPITYLNSLPTGERKKASQKTEYHNRRFQRMAKVTKDITGILEEEGIYYTTFKTLKPFREEVADVDILIFDSLKKATRALTKAGFGVLEKGSFATTLCDSETHRQWKTEIMIDLHEKICVNNLEYINKEELKTHIISKDLWGFRCNLLSLEADLFVLIAHSALKEWVLDLADYYTTLHYLSRMNRKRVKEFVKMVKDNHLKRASRWFLTLVDLLHQASHHTKPPIIEGLLTDLGGPWNEPYGVIKGNNHPPYPCSLLTLAVIFSEKLKDKAFRKSVPSQIRSIFRPDFVQRFVSKMGKII